MNTPEILSALADGQLGEDGFADALQACQSDPAALPCWSAYHLIGDVLRAPAQSAEAVQPDDGLAFLGRLNQRLAQEPLAAPALLPAALAVAPQADANLVHHRGPAANDHSFRWKVVAGVASLAAVCAVAWNAAGMLAPASAPQLAQASAPQIVVTSPQGPVVRDARLEELLAAHKQFGATSALQEPSGFLRNATFDIPQQEMVIGGR
ncbi:MAG: sigma-E factor negative regulatory protein [Polaromonas sp.]